MPPEANMVKEAITVPAPAKLNLFLHITGKRPDGYHTLQTLFQFIDLMDEITFQSRPEHRDITLSSSDPRLETDDNLIIRAARALQAATACTHGAHIRLTKHLPMGGGLGGGSSDAATTLVALNHLWRTGLDRAALQRIGLSLGADVPVFIYGQSALATGIGEELQAVDIPAPVYLIAIPNCHANTAELFQEKQLTRNSKLIRIRDFLDGAGHNDFEPVLRKRFPLIAITLDLMRTQGDARVTGSGCTLFMSCSSRAEAEAKQQRLQEQQAEAGLAPESVRWVVAQGLNRSPLYKILDC